MYNVPVPVPAPVPVPVPVPYHRHHTDSLMVVKFGYTTVYDAARRGVAWRGVARRGATRSSRDNNCIQRLMYSTYIYTLFMQIPHYLRQVCAFVAVNIINDINWFCLLTWIFNTCASSTK